MESIIATREEVRDFLSIQNYNYNCGYGSISGDGYGYGYAMKESL